MYEPDTISTFLTCHLILLTILIDPYYCFPHFRREKMDVWKIDIKTLSKLHGNGVRILTQAVCLVFKTILIEI